MEGKIPLKSIGVEMEPTKFPFPFVFHMRFQSKELYTDKWHFPTIERSWENSHVIFCVREPEMVNPLACFGNNEVPTSCLLLLQTHQNDCATQHFCHRSNPTSSIVLAAFERKTPSSFTYLYSAFSVCRTDPHVS